MIRKAYILTFDRDDDYDYKNIHDRIVSLPEVLNWFHYVKSSYILIATVNSATTLNNKLMRIMSNKRFLLIEVNIENRNGRLPQEGWEWLRRHVDDIT